MNKPSRTTRHTRRNPDEPIDLRPVTPAPDELPVPYRLSCPTSAAYPTAGRKVAS